MSHRILALWTVPRSGSTAFERMMMERGDHTVVHEPFSLHYYFGPDRRSARYDDVRPESSPEAILADLDAAARDRPVFVKDMAAHVHGLTDEPFLGRFTHTFLIRDPAWALPSLAEHWPDFTDEEAGYEALASLVDATTDRGSTPVIIDSDDLRSDPEPTVRAYCSAVGIPYLRSALTWAPGMPTEWKLWEEWHRDVAESRGFAPPVPGPSPVRDSRRVRDAYTRCAPIYERLLGLRLGTDRR